MRPFIIYKCNIPILSVYLFQMWEICCHLEMTMTTFKGLKDSMITHSTQWKEYVQVGNFGLHVSGLWEDIIEIFLKCEIFFTNS